MVKYRAIREIGRGGFGVVDEVEGPRGECYARKSFEPASYIPKTAHDKLRQRFRREVMIQELIGGGEVMPVIDSDLDAKSPWFVMPFAEKTYEQQISEDRRSGSVDIDAVADILNGLQYVHDLGYVHRDLNPKNILLHDGHWKLSDLGAVLPPTGQTVTLTEGTIIYTELYCAPEQRNNFHGATAAADIYALGCILHDIYGIPPRIPYRQQSAAGPIGVIIEKCTEITASRRPCIAVLRDLLLESLVEVGGHCRVEDHESEEWLDKLQDIDSWEDEEYNAFARFFAQLDLNERASEHMGGWVYSLSTPFLTRLPAEALANIVKRKDGVAVAIVEKYCEWVRATRFLFGFSDTVCTRLAAIFDNGTPSDKATAFAAMVSLGESHNRWFIMRNMLRRCEKEEISAELAKRLAIELKIESLNNSFRRCVDELKWSLDKLPTNLAKLCKS